VFLLVKRHLDSLDQNDIYDDVKEKKALPELILKQNILNAQDVMLMSERKMMNAFRYRNKYFKNDLIEFEGNIILLFGFIKRMILDTGIKKNSYDYKVFKLLCEAERGRQFNANYLIVFKNFLLKNLHTINITNLFMQKGKSFEQELEEF
jgi:hypothetical protein